jgi:thiamine biosynthesis protein ThiI
LKKNVNVAGFDVISVMNYDIILIRYGELSLKSPYVRKVFESTLVSNIKKALQSKKIQCTIKTQRGRIFLYSSRSKAIKTVLPYLFGITSFSPALSTSSNLHHISSLVGNYVKDLINKNKTFAVRVSRTGNHSYTSQDVAVTIGSDIVKQTKAQVNLTDPDIELFIEIRNKEAFVFTEKIPGPGGLPMGTQGTLLALVKHPRSLLAAWYLLRRGCAIVFLIVDNSYAELVDTFCTQWHLDAKSICFDERKKDLYKTIEHVALKTGASAIVTDHTFSDPKKDILGQLIALKNHLSIPVLHPLIAMEKNHIQDDMNEKGIL